jgi:hypothetical protein
MNRSHAFAFALALFLAAASGTCSAADAPSSGASAPGGRPPGPPPEAVAACNGKTAGTTVSFTGRNGETLTGVCAMVDGKLAARPSGPPPGQRPQQR